MSFTVGVTYMTNKRNFGTVGMCSQKYRAMLEVIVRFFSVKIFKIREPTVHKSIGENINLAVNYFSVQFLVLNVFIVD